MDHKPSLIIVDDETDIAEVLAILLEDYFECDISTAGHEALKKIRENHYDALITDLEMPDISGVELIDAARQIRSQLKIFISTGHTSDNPFVKTACSKGVDGILQKPFSAPEILVKQLQHKLKESASNSDHIKNPSPSDHIH